MNLNDFFSKPTRVKEAYTSNYPSSTTPADAAAAAAPGRAIDDPDIMGSLRSSSGIDRIGKKDAVDFRTGFTPGDDEAETEPEFMAEPNKYVQSWAPTFRRKDDVSGGNSPSSIAPYGWRYVEKGEDPARYGSASAAATGAADWGPASIPAAGKSAAASGLPKMRFDQATRSLVPVEEPIALDRSIKAGPNSNIDAATRDRARDWAARQNAPAAALAGSMNYSGNPVDTKIAPAAPAAAAPATGLKDLPVEKPSSWKDIAQANNISNPNRIMPGQVLKIPGQADYVVQPGDTLSKIAAGQTQTPAIPKITPTPGNIQPRIAPNTGIDFPPPATLGLGPEKITTYDAFGKPIVKKGGSEELVTPEMIRRQKQAAADISAIDKKMQDRAERAANRKKTNEDDIDDQTQVSSIERDSTSDTGGPADQHWTSTTFQHDPNNPANNSYMDRQDHNGVASTTYARNVTPKWMDNLKATAGLPGAKPAAQPPSQYPTQAGQGMNNKPFAAYSTPPGQTEITRESLDRMRFLAGIHKK
jgi:LysM repeat protein